MPKYQLFGFLILSAVTVVSFQNCSQASFSQAPITAASSTDPGSNTPDSGSYEGLKAVDITLAANVNVTMNITVASILAANSGSGLQLKSISAPDLGSLTAKSNSYDFLSSSTGTATMTYSIADNQNNVASAKIIVKVVDSSIATDPFYGCNLDGFLYSLDPKTGTVLKTVNLTYNGSKLQCSDMAINAAGELYLKDEDRSTAYNIYKVNVSTGVATMYQRGVVPSTDRAVGLTFGPDGKQLIFSQEHNPGSVNQTNNLVSIAPDGTKTILIDANAGYVMAGGDVKLLPDGYLYWTITNATSTLCKNAGAGGTQGIIKIDPVTKDKKEIACMDKRDIFGLGFASKGLYGFSGQGNLVRVDLSTGKTTLIKATGLTFIGAAANPILW